MRSPRIHIESGELSLSRLDKNRLLNSIGEQLPPDRRIKHVVINRLEHMKDGRREIHGFLRTYSSVINSEWLVDFEITLCGDGSYQSLLINGGSPKTK